MLTETEYNDLWTYSPNRIGSFRTLGVAQPLYNEYVIRENMFEDYLDIFRGRNTRGDRQNVPNDWYYEHPFFNAYGSLILDNIPCIRYVLIGEAAPKKKDANDLIMELHQYLTYIYNEEIPGGGQYITSILNAFNVKKIDGMETKKRLLKMAENGVILFDLFPFAFKYTSAVREILNENGITEYFFNSCLERIQTLIVEMNGQAEPEQPYRSAFVTPPKICNYLTDNINVENTFFVFDNQINTLNEMTVITEGDTIKISILLNGIYDVAGQKEIPSYKCCCYSGAKTVPHATFIKNALDLDL